MRSGVIDSRVLSLTLKRLRRLLSIRLRSEEDECRLYTINAWHCQAHISHINSNLSVFLFRNQFDKFRFVCVTFFDFRLVSSDAIILSKVEE